KLSPSKPLGSTFKVVLALNDLPNIADAPKGVPTSKLLEAQFRVGPSPEYIKQAIHDGIKGIPSNGPIIWGLVQSLSSPQVSPPGKHLMSLNVWHAPYSLGTDYWETNKDKYLIRVLNVLEEYFPGLNMRIEDIVSYSPVEIENEFNLTGSNITHGDMTTGSLLNRRPGSAFVDALAKQRITLGGAGTWPGGYVTGIPGRNAASKVIEKLKVSHNARILS